MFMEIGGQLHPLVGGVFYGKFTENLMVLKIRQENLINVDAI
jgi:hypothetical protein